MICFACAWSMLSRGSVDSSWSFVQFVTAVLVLIRISSCLEMTVYLFIIRTTNRFTKKYAHADFIRYETGDPSELEGLISRGHLSRSSVGQDSMFDGSDLTTLDHLDLG
jgi:hypothetical protein